MGCLCPRVCSPLLGPTSSTEAYSTSFPHIVQLCCPILLSAPSGGLSYGDLLFDSNFQSLIPCNLPSPQVEPLYTYLFDVLMLEGKYAIEVRTAFYISAKHA
jgi:hypothetical protein